MLKIFSPHDWKFGDQPIDIIRMTSGGRLTGADASVLEKRASSEFVDLARAVKIASDEVPVHVIAMGASERFSANRNGDGFKRAALQKYHDTFVKNSKWYRDHKNKDKSKSYGVVKMSYYNPEMDRVELLVALNATKEAADRNGGLVATRELEKLAKGDDLAVSMSCFSDPTVPVLTKSGYKNIADVVVGDFVWTHKRRWRQVTKLIRNNFTGTMCNIGVTGLPFSLDVTAEHPMFARHYTGTGKRKFTGDTQFNSVPFGWHRADELDVKDRLAYVPVDCGHDSGCIDDNDLALLLGYYTAEGSLGYNKPRGRDKSCEKTPCSVIFTCNWDDAAVRDIPRIAAAIFPDVPVGIKPHRNSAKACVLQINHTGFASFVAKLFKAGAKCKKLPFELFNASKSIKLSFLAAWLDGDGFTDKKGIHWSTANRDLALQGRDLLASVGIPSSIYKIDHSAQKNSFAEDGIEYTLNVSWYDAGQIPAAKIKDSKYTVPSSNRQKPPAMRITGDALYYAMGVKSVEHRQVENLPVYNLEVADDHSYTVYGLATHNCTINHDICSSCGNKAAKRADYCDETTCISPTGLRRGGCKNNLAKVAEDGHVIHVDNPHPNFFDISHVFRPADRIAYGNIADYLQKSASENRTIGGAELAEIMQVGEPLSVKLASIKDPAGAKMLQTLYALASIEDDVSDKSAELCRAFKSSFDRSYVFGTDGETLKALADRNVLIPVENFVNSTGYSDVQSVKVAEQLPGIFNRLISRDDLPELIMQSKFLPSRAPISDTKRAWATKFAEDLGLDEHNVRRRIWRSAITDLETPRINTTMRKSASEYSSREEKAATDYALYKLAFVSLVEDDNSGLISQLCVMQNYA